MEVQLAALADSANVSQEGKLNILGVFNTLWSTGEPVVWPLMYFVAKVSYGINELGPKGFTALELRVVDDDGGLAAPPVGIRLTPAPVQFPGEPFSGPIVVPIIGASFEHFGTYSFELRSVEGLVCPPVVLYVRHRQA